LINTLYMIFIGVCEKVLNVETYRSKRNLWSDDFSVSEISLKA